MPATIPRPTDGQFAHFHASYVRNVPDGDVLALLEKQGRETVALLRGLSATQSQHRYAPGKWSIREVVGHLSDAERVFTYRALSFARGDASALPGFDENAWGATTNAHQRSLPELLDEFAAFVPRRWRSSAAFPTSRSRVAVLRAVSA